MHISYIHMVIDIIKNTGQLRIKWERTIEHFFINYANFIYYKQQLEYY